MKKTFIVVVVICLMVLSSCTQDHLIDETDDSITELTYEQLTSSYISWVGRYHIQDEKAYFYYTATGFEVYVYGRLIQIDLHLEQKKNDIYYRVIKDGESVFEAETYVQKEPVETVSITFDDYGYHRLVFLKSSEPEDGITSLVGLKTNGEFLEVEEKEDKPHFLMLGASGISGHGALGSVSQYRTTANSSPFHSFGYLTAHHYEGTFEFVSASGWGLKFGYNDRSGEENIALAYEYVGITPDRHIVYEPSLNVKIPDYVIINLGGNDYTSVINKTSGFEKSENIQIFKDSVYAFIQTIRLDAPNAHIIWTMTEGSMNGTAANEVIERLDDKDKAFVHMVEILQVGQNQTPIGANNHASYETHQLSALNIIQMIDRILDNDVS